MNFLEQLSARVAEQRGVWRIHQSVEHLLGPTQFERNSKSLMVLCTVRDGALYVKSFMEHYLSLGVSHFVFLDNGSEDDTIRMLSSYPNVTLLRSRLPYKEHYHSMTQYLLNRYGKGMWALVADIDEHWMFPFSDKTGLRQFLGYLNSRKYNAVAAHLLEMFSDEPLTHILSKREDRLKDKFRYYDASDIHRIEYPFADANEISNQELPFLIGGIRRTAFALDNVYLTKHPLLLYGSGQCLHTPHSVIGARIADVSCVLLHYKFLGSFFEYAARSVREENHWNASFEYRKYLSALQLNPGLNLKTPRARKLNNVSELVENGFLTVTDQFVRSAGVQAGHSENSATSQYTSGFYSEYKDGSFRSASAVLPVVAEYVSFKSFVDLGCGAGAWASACARLGITDFLGIDGDHIDPELLMIPKTNFMTHDLTRRLDLGRTFDLVACLEVAEHLDERHADTLVDNLTRLGGTILFSAAVPGQGGLGHVNEQWPSYWEEKFLRKGFRYFDLIRPRIAGLHGVEPWYRENIYLVSSQPVCEV